MKLLILMLAVLLMVGGCMSLKTPDVTPVSDATYQEIIEAPGKSQQQLFEKSRQWLALTFVSSKKVIEYENATEGRIIGNGADTVFFYAEGAMMGKMAISQNAAFTITEDVKDGKARVVINNIREFQGHHMQLQKIRSIRWISMLQNIPE